MRRFSAREQAHVDTAEVHARFVVAVLREAIVGPGDGAAGRDLPEDFRAAAVRPDRDAGRRGSTAAYRAAEPAHSSAADTGATVVRRL
ncbi:MAG: hypothetical protein ACR2MO_10980 [Acidimicrobiales bacterium]